MFQEETTHTCETCGQAWPESVTVTIPTRAYLVIHDHLAGETVGHNAQVRTYDHPDGPTLYIDYGFGSDGTDAWTMQIDLPQGRSMSEPEVCGFCEQAVCGFCGGDGGELGLAGTLDGDTGYVCFDCACRMLRVA